MANNLFHNAFKESSENDFVSGEKEPLVPKPHEPALDEPDRLIDDVDVYDIVNDSFGPEFDASVDNEHLTELLAGKITQESNVQAYIGLAAVFAYLIVGIIRFFRNGGVIFKDREQKMKEKIENIEKDTEKFKDVLLAYIELCKSNPSEENKNKLKKEIYHAVLPIRKNFNTVLYEKIINDANNFNYDNASKLIKTIVASLSDFSKMLDDTIKFMRGYRDICKIISNIKNEEEVKEKEREIQSVSESIIKMLDSNTDAKKFSDIYNNENPIMKKITHGINFKETNNLMETNAKVDINIGILNQPHEIKFKDILNKDIKVIYNVNPKENFDSKNKEIVDKLEDLQNIIKELEEIEVKINENEFTSRLKNNLEEFKNITLLIKEEQNNLRDMMKLVLLIINIGERIRTDCINVIKTHFFAKELHAKEREIGSILGHIDFDKPEMFEVKN